MTEITKESLRFSPDIPAFLASRASQPLTVLSGANNSGKSLALKWLKSHLGSGSYMMGTNRFSHTYHLSSSLRDPNQFNSIENQFANNFAQPQFNNEQNPYDLNTVINQLGNTKRAILFKLCGDLLGSKFELKRVESDNDLSPSYIDMDGQNLSVGSSGTRLLMTFLGIFLDERYHTLLIDEPEIGLAPRMQQQLFALLRDSTFRSEKCPHLKQLFIATHSHLFLNRAEIGDNFIVSKVGLDIALTQIKSIADFHRLQFNLLGNSLEAMFLPSAIVVVEGKTDHGYIERLLALQFADRKIAVIAGSGDVKRIVNEIKAVVGEISSSPFRQRLFVILDSVHQRGLSTQLEAMGVDKNNIILWAKNGIEYVYPKELMCKIFNCSEAQLDTLDMAHDVLTLNGIALKKNELKGEILKRLDSTTILPEELTDKLLAPLEKAMQ